MNEVGSNTHSLLPLLKKISTNHASVTSDEIADTITHVSQNRCSAVQTGALLTAMHYTGLDARADVIAGAAKAMRNVGRKIDGLCLQSHETKGGYRGGLVDIVGTGGDGHDTFNVSTTAAIIAAGCGIRICKHGAKASTSSSGSADLLAALGAAITCVGPSTVADFYSSNTDTGGSFLFLYAPTFHPAMAHIAPIRRLLGCRTVFNVLGPLLNPVDYSLSEGLEARVLGVGKTSLGRTYADTLRLLGVQKAVVVCGEEDLDEVSIAGRTRCWRITPGRDEVEEFWIHPVETFGVDAHPLRDVAGGHGPEQNAAILRNILAPGGEGLKSRDPVSDFVLVNAALVVVAAGLVDSDETGEEVGKDGVMRGAKWKRAINLVRCAVDSGDSWRCWEKFVDISIHGREVGVF